MLRFDKNRLSSERKDSVNRPVVDYSGGHDRFSEAHPAEMRLVTETEQESVKHLKRPNQPQENCDNYKSIYRRTF